MLSGSPMRLVEDTGEDIEDRVDYREQARDEEVHEEVQPCRSPSVGHTTQRRVSNDNDMMKRPTSSRRYPSRETDHANRYSSSNASSNRPSVQFGGGQSAGGPVLADRWQQSIIDENASVIRSSVDPEGEQRMWDSDDIQEGDRGMGARVYSLADRLGRTEEYAHVGRNTLQRLSVDIGMMERPTSSRGYHSRETKRNPISATLPSGVVVGGTYTMVKDIWIAG